ncbi:hypothetical protein ANTRET_LOCUS9415, partial [Anthophora retusa]
MYLLNEGFHNFHDNKVNTYVWDETTASRGSQEIAYCCLRHLQNVTTQSHVIAYNDMCTEKNRNLQMALLRLRVVQSLENNIEVIDHKFLLSGHSYRPNDADFGIIMEDTEFKTLDLSPACRKRPAKFERIALAPLYNGARSITYEKYKDIEQLLPYAPVHHEYFKMLLHREHK